MRAARAVDWQRVPVLQRVPADLAGALIFQVRPGGVVKRRAGWGRLYLLGRPRYYASGTNGGHGGPVSDVNETKLCSFKRIHLLSK